MTGSGDARGPGLAAEPSFGLGPLRVRPTTREVLADGGGSAEVLEPRVMQVLVELARRRGQVVSRAELIDACWDGRAVGDDALNRCIQAIRRLAERHGGFSVLTVPRVGYRLDESPAPGGDAGDAPAPASPHERRRVTILACGLVRKPGLDLEEGYAIALEWRQAATAVLARFGGHVITAQGDRLVACFGYPAAQEDAAQRAVNAALAIAAARSDLSVRAGIHAGLVVVASDGGAGVEVFGEAPEVALEALAAAAPGEIAMTDAVQALVAHVVTAAPLRAGPTRLHRVIAAGPLRSRGFGPREATPFVGRDEEVRLLADRWARAAEGEGRLALVTGEPGIGKTRLVEEFRAGLGGVRVIACGGTPVSAATPFHVVAQILRQGLGWRDGDTGAQRIERLRAALAGVDVDVDEAVLLLGDLLELPVSGRLELTPEQQRGRLFAALAAWLAGATRGAPLLLVAEDLHWADPSSLEVLRLLAEQGATLPVMLLCTARPEFKPPWPARSHHTHLALTGLAAAPMRALVGSLVASQAGDDLVAAVIDRADGVPLFAEELVRLVMDDAAAPDPSQIPATLQDSLAARLDRLALGRPVAQLGAVLGRRFSHHLLSAVAAMPEAELQAGLAELAEAELIYVRGAAPAATYQFKHALIQDAAAGSLLKARRRELHAAVAEVLAARPEGIPEARPEVLAHHWTEADEAERAVAAWTQAAELAAARPAFAEAEESYRRALAVLLTTPDSAARDQQEWDLGFALVRTATATQGAQSAEVAAVVARNRFLSERLGHGGATTASRLMTFSHHTIAANWPETVVQADDMAAYAARLSRDIDPPALRFALAMVHFTRGTSSYFQGDLATAEREYARWEAFHDAGDYEQRISSTLALCNMAQLAVWLGRPDQALAYSAKARAWAASTDSAYDITVAEALTALLHVSLGDAENAEAIAAETVTVAEARGFPQAEGWTRACLGWARAQRGAAREGADQIQAAIEALTSTQTRISMPWFWTMLAEAQALDGRHDRALDSLETALTINPAERLYRPAALIGRGELHAGLGRHAPAEADFRAAIDEAARIGAPGYDLRAATGLARLFLARGAPRDAEAILRPRLDTAIATFDTPDVRALTAEASTHA